MAVFIRRVFKEFYEMIGSYEFSAFFVIDDFDTVFVLEIFIVRDFTAFGSLRLRPETLWITFHMR